MPFGAKAQPCRLEPRAPAARLVDALAPAASDVRPRCAHAAPAPAPRPEPEVRPRRPHAELARHPGGVADPSWWPRTPRPDGIADPSWCFSPPSGGLTRPDAPPGGIADPPWGWGLSPNRRCAVRPRLGRVFVLSPEPCRLPAEEFEDGRLVRVSLTCDRDRYDARRGLSAHSPTSGDPLEGLGGFAASLPTDVVPCGRGWIECSAGPRPRHEPP